MQINFLSSIPTLRGPRWIAAAVLTLGCGDMMSPNDPGRYNVTLSGLTPSVDDTVLVRARIVDRGDNPLLLAGRTVQWQASGGGHFSAPSSITGADGIATVNYVPGTKAGERESVSATDDQGVTGHSLPMIVEAGAPVTYQLAVTNSTPIVGSSVAVLAQIVDKYGNPAHEPGRIVVWSLRSPQEVEGAFQSASSTTDIFGTARVNLTAGTTAGVRYAVAVSDDRNTFGVGAEFVTVAGSASTYSVTASDTVPHAGGTVMIAAGICDAFNNPVQRAGRTVHWTTSGNGARLSVQSSLTGEDGIATVELTTSAAPGASYTVTASDDAGHSVTSPIITTQ